MAKIMLLAVVAGITGCASTMAAPGKSNLMGAWTVEYIGERPVIDSSPAFIEFAEEGRAGGNASCNRFTGVYVLSGSSMSFSNMASIKKMCFPALMEQETRFLAALERVAKVQIQNGLLVLLDVKGVAVFKAARKENLKVQQPESSNRRSS
jgi:heat shock protein HslJ